jgi:hypothetical protein
MITANTPSEKAFILSGVAISLFAIAVHPKHYDHGRLAALSEYLAENGFRSHAPDLIDFLLLGMAEMC